MKVKFGKWTVSKKMLSECSIFDNVENDDLVLEESQTRINLSTLYFVNFVRKNEQSEESEERANEGPGVVPEME